MVSDRAAGRVPQERKAAVLLGVLRQQDPALRADLASRQQLGPARDGLQQESLPSNSERDSDGEIREPGGSLALTF